MGSEMCIRDSSLPSSYPLSSLQLQRASDNLTVNGQWNLDNDSLVFWSTGPLEKETNYQLKLKGFVNPQNNLKLYPSQFFQFRTDNQTLNLNNGLVAYYPLDNDTLDYSGNGLHGINSYADNATDRFDISLKAISFTDNVTKAVTTGGSVEWVVIYSYDSANKRYRIGIDNREFPSGIKKTLMSKSFSCLICGMAILPSNL